MQGGRPAVGRPKSPPEMRVDSDAEATDPGIGGSRRIGIVS